MSNEGDSKGSKAGVLASIRRIMRGESADLGTVPAAGSKVEADSAADKQDWSLPPGALSEEEGGRPADPVDVASALAQQAPPAIKREDAETGAPADGGDGVDDVLPLSADMMVSSAPATPSAEDEVEVEDEDDALDLPASGDETEDPNADADAEAELFLTGAATLRRTAEADLGNDGADEIVEEPAGEASQEDWRLPEDEPDSSADAEPETIPESSGEDSWDVTVDETTGDSAEEAEDTGTAASDPWSWGESEEAAPAADPASAEEDDQIPEMPALTLGEIEDTVRRVVREELEGEEGGRLTEMIRRIVRQEVTRAGRDDD